jgi:putative tryptophan/tyrosine transport system substrate-binding protein
MRRRDFVAGLMIASAMRHAVAQQPAKAKRIAWVVPAIKAADLRADFAPRFRAFLEELNRLGYAEGRNLVIERYSGEGQTEQYAETVRDVVGTHPDLIFSTTAGLALAFRLATTEIPIVTVSADPVFLGLVPSLAHPGGNITGVTIDGGIELYEKRIQLLEELVPKLSNAFYLASQPYWEQSIVVGAYREAAKHAGISLIPILLGVTFNETAYESAFKSMEQQRADAFISSDEAEHLAHRAALVDFVAKRRLPAMFPYRDFVDVGGLMSYSISLAEAFRQVARQIASILGGTKPRDIPFYQPTRFEFVINMKTAKSLGISVPATLLARADEVIE